MTDASAIEQARFWIACAVVVVFCLLFAGNAGARDLDGKYANSPLHDWVSNLKNPAGGLCCDMADGHRLEDVDWKGEPDGTYSVRIDGKWVKLDKDQIITEPNKMGTAMVWIYMGRITCFIAGSGS